MDAMGIYGLYVTNPNNALLDVYCLLPPPYMGNFNDPCEISWNLSAPATANYLLGAIAVCKDLLLPRTPALNGLSCRSEMYPWISQVFNVDNFHCIVPISGGINI